MNKLKSILLATTFLAAGSSHAATVLAPTDGDVNFLDISLNNVPWAFELFMLDDNTSINNSLTSADGLLVPLPSIVGISGPFGSNYIATNANTQTMTLTDSDNFILAIHNLDTGDWIEDIGAISMGANAQRIIFEFTNSNESTAILSVDVEVVPVPVPAALWLFASGLAGIISIGKRFAF